MAYVTPRDKPRAQLERCDGCGRSVPPKQIQREVKAIESAIYAGSPNYVTKRICVDCDKVECAACGEKAPSRLARGFIGTKPSEKRYTPYEIENGRRRNAWELPPLGGYLESDFKGLLHYYCTKCVQSYSESQRLQMAWERHLQKHGWRAEKMTGTMKAAITTIPRTCLRKTSRAKGGSV